MFRVLRRQGSFRGLVAAVATLTLGAGVAIAGSAPQLPAASATGLGRAADSAGKTVPVAGGLTTAPGLQAGDESAPEPDSDAAANAATHPDNHGALVSVAAQAATPDGFANHGEYVRTIARDNAGQAQAADATQHASSARAAHPPVKPTPTTQ